MWAWREGLLSLAISLVKSLTRISQGSGNGGRPIEQLLSRPPPGRSVLRRVTSSRYPCHKVKEVVSWGYLVCIVRGHSGSHNVSDLCDKGVKVMA